ncbi:MAG: HupE/UreJ family protein, partial [Burkholderiales bacterium]
FRPIQCKLSFLDLEVATGVDQDLDGSITWGEAKASLDKMSTYVLARTTISAGGACTLKRQSAEPIRQEGEGYLSLTFSVDCPDASAPAQITSSIFLDIDPTSKILINSHTSQGVRSYVIGANEQPKPDTVSATPQHSSESADAGLLSYFAEGISHLFGGPDHMLFLLVLIIPAIYAGRSVREVAIAVLLPITGFTLGHALTLTSAASGLIRPPAQLVEVLIAITILLTAIDNVRRFIPGPRSVVAFIFGLIHGFGFASALGALELSGWSMGVALLGFNLGIEAGQAVLALAVAPLLFLVRAPAKRFWIMPLGISVVAGLMAIFWIAERTGLL